MRADPGGPRETSRVRGRRGRRGGRRRCPARAARPPLPPPLIKEGVTQKIAEHVYVIPDFDVVLVPTSRSSSGTRGALVVDTGLGAKNGQTVMREVEKVSKGQELYLVTTHIHPEHDLGAGGFPARTKMLRSKEQEADIQETGLATAKIFANFSPLNGELLQGAEFRKADISFDREHVVDLGGVRARVMAMGANHTKSDIAVFVEPDRVLVAGRPRHDGAAAVHRAVGADCHLARPPSIAFDALKPVRIVPSHGAMGDASMIAAYRVVPHHRARPGRGAEEGRQDDRRDRARAAGRAAGALQPQPDGQRHPRRLQRGTIGPCTTSLLFAHSWLRWLVLLAGLAAVARAVGGVEHAPPVDAARRPRRDVVHRRARPADAARARALHLPEPGHASRPSWTWRRPCARRRSASSPSSIRSGMIVAIALAHVGRVRIRKAPDSESRHKRALIFFGLSLLVMLLSIPWPIGPGARSLFRGL